MSERGIIYIITNDINNKVYVGQTTQTLQERWNGHIRTARSNTVPHFAIHNALNKYGVEHFKISAIENNVLYSELNKKERYWIEFYNSKSPNGYNLTDGGDDCGRKVIYKINIFSNDIIEEYGSATEAALLNNLDLSGITKVCRQVGNDSSYGGYKWCYAENYDIDYLQNLKTHCTRKICQIEQGTKNIIKVWNSVQEACANTKTNQASLSGCLNGKSKTANGFCWCYYDDYINFMPKTEHYPVLQINKETGELIKKWNCAKDAALSLSKKETSGIRAVCRGKQKTAYGFKWCYEKEGDNE